MLFRLGSFTSFVYAASISLLFAASTLPAASQEAIIYSFGGSTATVRPLPPPWLPTEQAIFTARLTRGGASECGAVFELSLQANGNWAESVIYSFPKQGSLCTGMPGQA